MALQEQQRAERQAARAAGAQLSVRDKTTFASRQQALFTDDAIKSAFHEALQAGKKVMLMSQSQSSSSLEVMHPALYGGTSSSTKALRSVLNQTACHVWQCATALGQGITAPLLLWFTTLQVTALDPDASLAAAAVAAVPRRVARENIKELLAKKRETLLVQVRQPCGDNALGKVWGCQSVASA